MTDPTLTSSNKNFLTLACSRPVFIRALKVALLVGTMLAFINHGEKILDMSFSAQDWFKILLTYLVPYSVSTWSAVGAIKANSASDDSGV